MRKNSFLTFLVATFLWCGLSSASFGGTALSLLEDGFNVLSDADYETIAGDGDNLVEQGEILFGVFELDAINGTSTGTVGQNNMTGIFAARAFEVTTTAGVAASYKFEAITNNEWLALFGIAVEENLGGETAIMVFDNAEPYVTLDASDFTSFSNVINIAKTGTKLFEFGFKETTDEWRAESFSLTSNPQDITGNITLNFAASLSVTSLTPVTQHIVFNGVTSTDYDALNIEPIANLNDGQVHIRGQKASGSFLTGAGEPVLPTRSQFYTNLTVTPEPASMLVWAGIGLAGAVGGVIRRRRK